MKQWEIFVTFLRLGCTSFGGPVAHLGFFHAEFVRKKKWLEEEVYLRLVTLCQVLPGPASSQLGISIGLLRGGILGSILAWVGFTLPSVILLSLFAFGLFRYSEFLSSGAIHGMKVAGAAIVAHAVLLMLKRFGNGFALQLLAGGCTLLFYSHPRVETQFLVLAIGALAGNYLLKGQVNGGVIPKLPISKRFAFVNLFLFVSSLLFLPLLAKFSALPMLTLFDRFFRVGSLVFGGGHVVLPLLQAEVVNQGWISEESFLAGYGFAQALPGPLFSFASYIGFLAPKTHFGWVEGLVSVLAIFLPSFFLIYGALPLWEKIQHYPRLQRSLVGINVAVVGLLFAAFLNPVWETSIRGGLDIALFLTLLLLLIFLKLPSWAVVILGSLTALGLEKLT